MTIESDYLDKGLLFTCPFDLQCVLPKLSSLCKIPECKICPEYSFRLKKMKSRVLH